MRTEDIYRAPDHRADGERKMVILLDPRPLRF